MQDANVRLIMIILAVSTMVVGGIMLLFNRPAPGPDESLPPRMRRNIWLLFFAGPANLAVWYLFNSVLEGVGSRSVVGYMLAAVIFVVAGLGTGFFSRLRDQVAARRDRNE